MSGKVKNINVWEQLAVKQTLDAAASSVSKCQQPTAISLLVAADNCERANTHCCANPKQYIESQGYPEDNSRSNLKLGTLF